MKRKISILLALVMLLALCPVSTLAATDTITAAGFYSIEAAPSGVTVTPQASSGTVERISANVDGKDGFETFYANSDKLSVSLKGTADSQYLVILYTGSESAPQESTICYIDQVAAGTGGSVSFDVFPKLPAESSEMHLWITSNAAGFETKKITLYYAVSDTYTKQPYVLGDVDASGTINASDALMALQIAGELITPTETQRLAANVDGNTVVNANDALEILQYAGGLITEW